MSSIGGTYQYWGYISVLGVHIIVRRLFEVRISIRFFCAGTTLLSDERIGLHQLA